MRAKGVGVSTLEGMAPSIYKSYFASIGDYQAALRAAGVKENAKPEPTAAQIDRFLPSLDDGKDDRGGEKAVRGGGGGDYAPSGKPAAQVAAEMGDADGIAMHDGSMGTGFAKANAMRNRAAGGGQTRTQKKEAAEEAQWAAQSGEVTVRQAVPAGAPEPAKDDW
jgi:hypothetical protein